MATLIRSTIENTEVLKHLFSEDWFEESEHGEVYIRYYSMPFEPKEDFYIPGLDGGIITYSGAPFRVVVAHISDQKYESFFPVLVKYKTGKHEVFIEKIDRVLPEANYVLISTPIRAEDNTYKNASGLMDGFAGMLRLVGGSNLLRNLVREAAVDVTSGNMRTLTEVVPTPIEFEGPFATEQTWQQFKEVADAIASKDRSEGGANYSFNTTD